MDAIDIEGDIWDGDGVHFASELHLQHALKAPIHEGGVRDPWGHCGVNMHTCRFKYHKDQHLSFSPKMFPCPHTYFNYRQLIHLLTEPHVLQADDKATGQIEDSEQGVAHEGWGLQGGQRSGHKQSHGPAAVNHQPHQHEVEQEALRSLVEPGQPIDGQAVHQGEHTVLR